MDQLPHFNQEQKDFVIECLTTSTPYKEIGRVFSERYPDYAAEMDENLYLEKFAAKCRRYVADKRKPEYQIIKKGRAKASEDKTIQYILLNQRWYRDERRQQIVEEMRDIATASRSTTNPDELNGLKHALVALKAEVAVMDSYDRRELDREKMENSYKSGGHGITIPETVEVER